MYSFNTCFTQSWKRVCYAVALATLLLAVFSMSLGATPAHAASKGQTASLAARATTSECQSPGNYLDSFDIKDKGGNKIGELEIYYNSANGYNCAYTRSFGTTKKQDMEVTITSCQETSPGGGCIETKTVTDEGMYSEYAGPVGVYAKGHCIAATGRINGAYSAHLTPFASYCH